MTGQLRISVIINTYDRGPLLERLLAGLNQLRYDAFEVVVVNGPSTDGTADLLARYEGRIKVVDCPVAHMTTSRNLGIAAAAGDVVVFIDDDARPAFADWLDNIARAFSEDAEGKLGAVGGPVLFRDTHDYQFLRGMTSDYVLQVFWGDQEDVPKADGRRWVRRTMGCNSAFRRDHLLEIGGFDERIGYYGDEADVCLRLARAGYDTAQPNDCVVRHYPAHSTHLGAPFMRNRRIITHDDTYSSLKNGNDPLPRRVLKTLWLATRKLYFTEMPTLWRAGRLSLGRLLWFYAWQWPGGFISGFVDGLFRSRGIRLPADPPPAFLPFRKVVPERRLKVALVTLQVPPDPGVSGVGRYAFDLGKGLHELGHEVHVIAQSEARVRRETLGFTVHGIPWTDFADRRLLGRPVMSKNVAYGLAVARKLEDLYEQGIEFDVVDTANWDLLGLCFPFLQMYPWTLMLVSPLAGMVETQRWHYDEDLEACVELDRWQIENADVLCVPSNGIMEVYRRTMALDFELLPPVHRVPLGVAPDHQRPAGPTLTPDARKRLLFVGRLERRKGAQVLLQALPELLSRHQDWVCDLVGSLDVPGGYALRQEFLERHRAARWLGRVRFRGVVEDSELHGYYAACDVFVAPALSESFGLTYAEAMQHGKPVVGTRAAGIPEVVGDGVEGLLAEPGDASSLMQALDRLMSDGALRSRLGAAGRQRVQRDLNHLEMARRMVPVYEEVIAAHGDERRQSRRARLGGEMVRFEFGQLRRDDIWRFRDPGVDLAYLFSQRPGATIGLEVPGGSRLCLVTLRHPWSGMLAVSANGHRLERLDLFNDDKELEKPWEIPMPGGPGDRVAVGLEVLAERHPSSVSTEVWIRSIGYRVEPR